MFSFEPIDKCFYQGIPVGDKDSIEQRFVVRFGIETLDNRLFVVLDKENIRFFYYDNNEQTETHNADDLKEVGFISLNYQKYTGNDILDFPQMSCGVIENIPDKEIVNKIIDSFKELFHGFPFLGGKTKNNFWTKIKIKKKDIKEEKESKERYLAFCNLLKCCFLAFVFKIEDRSEIFAQSPLYEHVRDTLRKSDVYQLLSAKIQYTLSVPKDGLVYNSKEYTYKARKFADCLMSQRINKVIPHDNYGNKEGKQGWFYDPEKELDAILEQNRKQEKKRQCTLDETLVRKIRDFLYTKHAVYQAMTSRCGKNLFIISQVLMFIWVIIAVFASICFESSRWDCLYNHYICFWGAALGIILLIIISGSKDRGYFLKRGCFLKGLNALYPRILVAEFAGWLMVSISEDLIKSMLWIESGTIRIALIVIVSIVGVGVIVWGETKQHSPYLGFKNAWKTMLIMNHSVFFALFFGCLMQWSFYDNLLKNSNVLPDVVYKEHFDLVDDYLAQIEGMDNSFVEYRRFVQDYHWSNVRSLANNKTKASTNGFGVFRGQKDTLFITLNSDFEFQRALIDSLKKTNEIEDYHDNLVKAIDISISQIIEIWNKNSVPYDTNIFKNNFEYCLCQQKDTTRSDTLNSIIHHNIELMTKIKSEIGAEKQMVNFHKMHDRYDDLIAWAAVDTTKNSTSINDSCKATGSKYIDTLVQKVNLKKCCRILDPKKSKHFYPNLLLLHMIIVLMIAFVTQLIISDKSVTEPL